MDEFDLNEQPMQTGTYLQQQEPNFTLTQKWDE